MVILIYPRRALVGGDEDDDEDSVLQDTMAEPSLTASQIIQHDSQYSGMYIPDCVSAQK